MNTDERRAPGATRIPFDALVEVGGALGPTFEAQAVNVSEEGIQLRTAYLPEPGQPLTCRFDGGPGRTVLAAGEVAWSQGAERGGEFGVRFTEVDVESVDALKRICGAPAPGAVVQPGARVRLHIDGLASPMRAKIKDARTAAVTVGSDLGFLQVGRPLELEDAQSGAKRPANIDRVEVAVDPASQVPQLVVTLRYADASEEISPSSPAVAGSGAHLSPRPSRPPMATRTSAPAPSEVVRDVRAPAAARDDLAAVEDASAAMKGALARSIDKIGPAIGRFAEQAKTMVAVLAARRGESSDGASARRTTAPPPGGGLHADGRRVVRASAPDRSEKEDAPVPMIAGLMTRRRAAVAGGVMIAAILGGLALKKVHHEPVATTTAPADSSALAAAAPNAVGSAAASGAPIAPQVPAAPPPAEPASPVAQPQSFASSDDGTDDKATHHKRVHVAPFTNGPVHHGNVLHVKMDGVIEAIEGAQQPTGFAVKLPGRKAVEAAAPLAARDSRIAAIKVTNGSAGAELDVTFRDGVPNYRVSAKGDMLVIALAPPGPIEPAIAKKDEKGGQSPTHARHAQGGSNVGEGTTSGHSRDARSRGEEAL